MAGVERVEEDARLRATNFAHDDPARPVAQRGLQQVAESDLALVGIELGLGGDDMRLLYIEFGHVFEDEDAVAVGDESGDDVGERRFSGPGSPGY